MNELDDKYPKMYPPQSAVLEKISIDAFVKAFEKTVPEGTQYGGDTVLKFFDKIASQQVQLARKKLQQNMSEILYNVEMRIG